MAEKIIMVAGAGQNVGKTTLCCELIKQLSPMHQLTALKLASHRHELTRLQKIILQKESLLIAEEKDADSDKDSSRFLRAGASQSLFVQSSDDGLPDLANWINQNIEGWLVIESGILAEYLQPHLAVFVGNEKHWKQTRWTFEFEKTNFDGNVFFPSVEYLLAKLK
ncbi:hypothetical protein [Roseimarinus sediminis]|uniref:hypothetical protein n=1 Tax=Roseimarinus sediminis TaxID=1610899 RepID=UPI003D2437D4